MINEFLQAIKEKQINFQTPKNDVYNLYYDFVKQLTQKYGAVNADYDDVNIVRRGKEWLDIHHLCEMEVGKIGELDNIATRTKKALKEKNSEELSRLKPYNKKDKLCYANKIEHFVLHYLIDVYRGFYVNSDGCWWLLASIYDVEYKTNFKLKHLIEVQKNKNDYFDQEDFNYLFTLANILKNERNSEEYNAFIVRQAIWVCDPDKYFGLLGIKWVPTEEYIQRQQKIKKETEENPKDEALDIVSKPLTTASGSKNDPLIIIRNERLALRNEQAALRAEKAEIKVARTALKAQQSDLKARIANFELEKQYFNNNKFDYKRATTANKTMPTWAKVLLILIPIFIFLVVLVGVYAYKTFSGNQ